MSVCFLRTQQRAKSQCIIYVRNPRRGWFFGAGSAVIAMMFELMVGFLVSGCLLRGAWCQSFNGEFDSGSGRTLAACLTHASRTERPACGYSSGERVSNTWATCPQLWDNSGKPVLILDIDFCLAWGVVESFSAGDGPAAYQLVGGVMAYQGDDG